MRLRNSYTAPLGLPGRELRIGESGEFPPEVASNPGVAAFLSVGWLTDETAAEEAKAAETAARAAEEASAAAKAAEEAKAAETAKAPEPSPAPSRSGRGGK